jgi:hypothetical protein
MKKHDEGMLGYLLGLRLIPEKPEQVIIDPGPMLLEKILKGDRTALFKGLPDILRLMQVVHFMAGFGVI